MRVIGEYLRRFLRLWLFWFWAPVLDVLTFLADPYIPGFSFPREIYWAVPLLGVVVANIRLFAEVESEKQSLQDRIDEFEDMRADIRFKKLEDFYYTPSSQAQSPFPGLKVKLDYYTLLDENGLPGWIVIGAYLEGEKKSWERGELIWEIIEADLPPFLALDESNKGQFQWANMCPFTKIDDWKDDFEARYEVALQITQRGDPLSFARSLSSPGFYRVVIHYWTKRGIDSKSKTHSLVLEGDLDELRLELCKKWSTGKFDELATAAGCQ
jgi:hypothetical protein